MESKASTEEPRATAVYRGDRIEVSSDVYSELSSSGYGRKEDSKFILEFYEAMYLLEAGKIKILDEEGETISFEELAEIAQRKQSDAWTKFLVYKDLRSRGYVVREGFGLGTDLRVYERGEYPEKPAKYVVFALDEGIERSVEDIRRCVREITVMGKEAIIAVLERRGEVIYYRVSATKL